MSEVFIPINPASSAGQSSSSSLWDRLTTWASEHKVVVYTVAGTAVVVTGAGVVYYLSTSKKTSGGASISTEKRKSKKERRKEKKAAGEGKSVPDSVKNEGSGMLVVKLQPRLLTLQQQPHRLPKQPL